MSDLDNLKEFRTGEVWFISDSVIESARKELGATKTKMHDVFRYGGDVFWFADYAPKPTDPVSSTEFPGAQICRRYIVDNRLWVRFLWVILWPMRLLLPRGEQNLFVAWGIVGK